MAEYRVKKVSSRQKNAVALRLRGLLNELEADFDDNLVCKWDIRGRFADIEDAYRDYQTICTDMGRFLEEWSDVDKLANLKAECGSFERDFSAMWKCVSERLAHTLEDGTLQENKGATRVKQHLFNNTHTWTPSMVGDDNEEEIEELQSKIEALQIIKQQASQRRHTQSVHESDSADSESGRSFLSARDLSARQKIPTSTPGTGDRSIGRAPAVSPIPRGRGAAGSVMDSLSQGPISESSYHSFRGIRQDPNSLSFMRRDSSVLSQDLRGTQLRNRVRQPPAQDPALCGSYVQQKQNNQRQEPVAAHAGGATACGHTERHLVRVQIPEFSGDKHEFEHFWAAFLENVDKDAAAPVSTKLLRLHQALKGVPAREVKRLGHGPEAYLLAMENLEEKYGGSGRNLSMRVTDLQRFKMIRDNNIGDMEAYMEMLDGLILSLRRQGAGEQMGCGVLYTELQQKLGQALLTRFRRWQRERGATEDVYSLRTFMREETRDLLEASELVQGVPVSKPKKDPTGRSLMASATTSRPAGSGSNGAPGRDSGGFKCKHCGGKHGVWRCEEFQSLTTAQRWEKAREHHLCFRCLSAAHRGIECTWGRRCGVDGCSANHHALLHDERGKRQSGKAEGTHGGSSSRGGASTGGATSGKRAPGGEKPATTGATKGKPESKAPADAEKLPPAMMGDHVRDKQNPRMDTNTDYISLRTVTVMLSSPDRTVTVQALLDDGASLTYVTDLAKHMGLQGERMRMGVRTLGGGLRRWVGELVTAKVTGIGPDKEALPIAMRTAPGTIADLNPVNWRVAKHNWPHLQDIPFPPVIRGKKIELLIGNDNSHLHECEEERPGRAGEPYARLTPLGWTAVGPSVSQTAACMHSMPMALCTVSMATLESQVQRFWYFEEPPEGQMRTQEEMDAEKQLDDTCRDIGGRYEVGMPWKKACPPLPNSKPMALKRLELTERKLQKDPLAADGYNKIIHTYLEKGYIRKVPASEKRPILEWYTPHFAVVRLDKTTTKYRIVFDGSATVNGLSLNMCLLPGPNLQCSLLEVLLRFRRWPIAVACDIAEMYLQVRVREEDRGVLRFLWRDMDVTREADVYEFLVVMFGLMPSPYQAIYSVKKGAKKHQLELPLAAETVIKSTYMDDSLDSQKNEALALQLYQELKEIWKRIGMWPRKWASNSKELLRHIPVEDQMATLQLDNGELGQVKTLGVSWNAEQDCFTFDVLKKEVPEHYTKRTFLSAVATLFDPLGLAGPVVARGRILLQRMWMAGADWDQALPGELDQQAQEWFQALAGLTAVRVPRPLINREGSVSQQLHVFSDASGEAYGAVAYMRTVYSDGGVSVALVMSKVKVAPMQATSIPRLELMGAAIGVKMAIPILKVMELTSAEAYYWTDSTDVLYWVHGCSRHYRPFVANRVGYIQQQTDLTKWRHVPTKVNPADCLSRGMEVSELRDHQLWWAGPDYLPQDSEEWPQIPVRIPTGRKGEEKKPGAMVALAVSSPELGTLHLEELRLNPIRFSQWSTAVAVCGWVLRFAYNCGTRSKKRRSQVLSPEEREDASVLLFRYAQQQAFDVEILALQKGKTVSVTSKLSPLKPWMDEDNLLRLDGRLRNAEEMTWGAKNPIILPRSHPITDLVIREMHEKLHHSGLNHTLAGLSPRFWIVAAREAIRAWLGKCMVCRRRRATPASQIMAPLPAIRIQKTLQAFQNISVDYAGPFVTKQGRGKTRQKRYLCLFDCLNTRGVHLEVANAMDVHAFLNAFSRMIARRGKPAVIWSDNGTNFVAANRELQDAVRSLDTGKLQEKAAAMNIEWKFNPPAAPHMNGVHEILVKAAKRAMHAIMGNSEVSDEELHTIVVTVEGLMNSRPLGYQTSDPRDDAPLTPNHFLMGRAGEQMVADPEVGLSSALSLRHRWRRVQEVVRHFWDRWQQEIVPAMQPRSKWRRQQEDVLVGAVVLVVEHDQPRGHWTLGRVTAVYPGSDGHVRAVDVVTRGNTYRRPINRICPLDG